MEINHLNSLRLGFSTKQASKIKKNGVNRYISKQLKGKNLLIEPEFLEDSPKDLKEYGELKKALEKEENSRKNINLTGFKWKSYLVQRCNETEFPLLEKINLMFQNQFVVTLQSVKLPYWIYQHYKTINENALGNYKTLVKEMIYTNAMIKYLDNQQNRKGKTNENLARELLELFTLGEGHYAEADIKNTALALVGLVYGEEKAEYKPKLKDNATKSVFGKSGNFIIDDVIDIIFDQENTSYFFAEKCLKWFFYDQPNQELVVKYGDVLKNTNFELKPSLMSVPKN
jgi:uncharacterized protein (DUF1800 family)